MYKKLVVLLLISSSVYAMEEQNTGLPIYILSTEGQVQVDVPVRDQGDMVSVSTYDLEEFREKVGGELKIGRTHTILAGRIYINKEYLVQRISPIEGEEEGVRCGNAIERGIAGSVSFFHGMFASAIKGRQAKKNN